MEELKTIELKCEKEKLLDYNWLFNNIPWSNFVDEKASISFNTPIEAYAIDIDGADTNIKGIKKFYFDNAIVIASHATTNSFYFIFSLSGEKTHETMDENSFGYSIDDVKNRAINKFNNRIKFLKYQINNIEVAIDKINEIQ